MKFGDKLRELRIKKKWSQKELSEKMGMSRKTIVDYENNTRLPKSRRTYDIIADIFRVTVDYLRDENENFITEATEKYGARGRQQAEILVNAIGGMFAGGELSEDDMDGVMQALQMHYWRAKEINKKYTPKKYRHED